MFLEPELTIVILAKEEKDNLVQLIPELKKTLDSLALRYEILIVDGNSSDGTIPAMERLGCKAVPQKQKGYGSALIQAIDLAKGGYILTMDADFSHDPQFVHHLWAKRAQGDLIVASRYVDGGKAEMPFVRLVLSRILNAVFSRVLSLPLRDISSGFRLYSRSVLQDIFPLHSKDFDILQEALIKTFCHGWKVLEVPFSYRPRHKGRSKAKILSFGIAYLRTLRRMWQLRNSAFSCDYDSRAYSSRIPLQRYWQRKRYSIVMGYISQHTRILDVGCGSSKIIQSLPAAVALDIDLKKLRYLKTTNPFVLRGSLAALPFSDGKFSAVICSEVIEHISKDPRIFGELKRVLSPGGELIIGTPDYASLWWRIFEWGYGKVLPMAYAEQHISHYTGSELEGILQSLGFDILDRKYIAGSEMIFKARRQL